MWKFKWFDQAEALADGVFGRHWQETFATSTAANVFQSPRLIRGWLETKGRALGTELCVCYAQDDCGRCVLLPFSRIRARAGNLWQRRLVGIGQPHFDYQDPLLSEALLPEEMDTFWNELSAEFTARRVCETAEVYRLSDFCAPSSATRDAADSSPYIDLREFDSFDHYLESVPCSHRGDVGRQRRRLAALGPIKLDVFTGDRVSEALSELNALRSSFESLWRGDPSEFLFSQPGTWDFYNLLVRDGIGTGLVHFSVLRLNSRAISWHLGFLHRDTLHYYKPTYVPDLKVYSPGKVHLSMLLQLGFQQGWKELDFGCGTEDYKYRWTDRERPLFQWSWRANTFRGRVSRWIRSTAKPARHLLRRRADS